jgi:hypothetical protein
MMEGVKRYLALEGDFIDALIELVNQKLWFANRYNNNNQSSVTSKESNLSRPELFDWTHLKELHSLMEELEEQQFQERVRSIIKPTQILVVQFLTQFLHTNLSLSLLGLTIGPISTAIHVSSFL